MPLDGITTKCLAAELARALDGARIDRVAQPGRFDVVLHLRRESGTLRLLLSANPSAPRVHFLDGSPENPPEPPVFCMLLRKHLLGGRILGVTTADWERVLEIRVQTLDEIGDRVEKRLVAELMGKQSNLVLVGAGGRILDALVHVDESVSRVREVMPGRPYVPVPSQGKPPARDVLEAMDAGRSPFAATTGSPTVEKALLGAVQGFSPPLCRDVCRRAGLDPAAPFASASPGDVAALSAVLRETLVRILEERFAPTLFFRSEEDPEPYDFHALPLSDSGFARPAPSVAEAMARVHAGRSLRHAFEQAQGELLRAVEGRLDKAVKRLAVHEADVAACAGRDRWKRFGDLILASAGSIPEGAAAAAVPDFYGDGTTLVEVPLDPSLSASRNAQRYFRRYAKERAKEESGLRFAEEDRKEIEYLASLREAVRSADDRLDLEALREEVSRLEARPAAAPPAPGGKRRKPVREPKALPPRRYVSSDGFEILVGRSNLQNDQLTLKRAAPDDLWLHVRQAPGTHVVVRAEGRPVPDRTVVEAAELAAWFSRAAAAERSSAGTEGAKAAVDYCPVRSVKKPPGAKPGMVTYRGYRTVLVVPKPPKPEAPGS